MLSSIYNTEKYLAFFNLTPQATDYKRSLAEKAYQMRKNLLTSAAATTH
jgi:hypothetical protein